MAYVRMHKDVRNRVDHTVKAEEYTVDASGKTMGRVATDAAMALLGKKSVHYVRNKVLPVTVTITNAAKLRIPEKRIAEKEYTYFTGAVGGLRRYTLAELIEKKGIAAALEKAVDGMIPRNKLRKERMKRLIIKD